MGGGKDDLEARGAEKFKEFDEDVDPALAEFEKNRREYITAMKRIRLENPDISLIELEAKAREEVVSKGPKSRAYYRAQATRKMAGKEDSAKAFKKQLEAEVAEAKAAEEAAAAAAAESEKKVDDGICRIMFDPPHYTVMEAVGTFTFGPGETQKMVTLEVLDDDVFEEDEHFY